MEKKLIFGRISVVLNISSHTSAYCVSYRMVMLVVQRIIILGLVVIEIKAVIFFIIVILLFFSFVYYRTVQVPFKILLIFLILFLVRTTALSAPSTHNSISSAQRIQSPT